jgi:drug/metabolite transporter (DMT)-like permease
MASLIFVPLLMRMNRTRDDIIPSSKTAWLMILGLSLSGVAVNNTIFYLGLERTDASVASIIVSLNPLMAMIFAVIMLGEKFTKKKGLSVVLGMVGVGLIIGFTETSGQLVGNLLILLGITIWGASFSFSRRASETGMSSIAITGWSETIGSLFLLPFILQTSSFSKVSLMTGETLFWFLFMALLSSFLAYILHYQAIWILGASTVAPSTNIIPLSGVITAYLLLGETITGFPIIGAAFVLTGVVLVQKESYDLQHRSAE